MPMYAIGIEERRDNIMANYVKKIRTESGEMQIDYEALANLPQSDATLTKSGSFADAKATGDAITTLSDSVDASIQEVVTQTEQSIEKVETQITTSIGAITPESIGALPNTYVAPVTSVDGKTGAVTTGAYTASNPPPYPVTSVNSKTGAVTLSASDVGAATSSHSHSNYMPKFTFSLSGTTLTITT